MRTYDLSRIPLKRKLTVYLFLLALAFLIVIIAVTEIIFRRQFQNLAHKQIKDKIEIVHRLIDSEISRLVQINKDWGVWDETYQFVLGKNPAYKENNLIPASFVTLDLRFIIYYDLNGNVIYAGQYEPETETIIMPDNELCDKFQKIIQNEQLRNHLIAGEFTIIRDKPYLISAESILTSQRKGPFTGWLLMARPLNLKPIMDLTGIMIDVRYDDSTDLCLLNNINEEHLLSIWNEKDRIGASHKFYDVISQKIICVNIYESNAIVHQGKKTLSYILTTIIIFGLLIFHLIIIVINNSILKPLTQISRQLSDIDLEKTQKRIQVSGASKEFIDLIKTTNSMLETINQQKKEIIESENRYRDLVENAEVGILVDDIDGNVVYFNEKLARIFGYTSKEFKKLRVEDYIHPDDLRIVRFYHRQRIKGEDAPKIYEVRGIYKNGNIINLEVNTIILQKNGKIVGTRNYIVDITARKKFEEKLTAQSMLDELTGLFNRRGFNKLGEQQIYLSKKTGKGFYILYCDLNGMKQLNDRFGHNTGDMVLKQVGNILKNSFRKSDIIARVGGDEFIILAAEAQPETIDVMLNRLKNNIQKHNESNNYPEISLSIGYAYFNPSDSKSLKDIINIADKMMYEEKLKFKQKT